MIPQAERFTPLDRFFGLFTRLRPGEGRGVFLFFWLGFVFMFGQWVLKPIRDVFILTEADAELAAYGNAIQAVLLMLLIPLYGVLYRHLSKTRLVQVVTVFFIATLLLFYFLYEMGAAIYFPFYIWVGLYGTMLIAQFWALAADHFNVKSGQRLFGVFAGGVSLGAMIGPLTVGAFMTSLGPGNLLLLVAGALVMTLFLIDSSVAAIPEGSRSTGSKDDAKKKSSTLGGFATVLGDRYLTLIAAWVVLQNIIDSTGDYILRTWVQRHANDVVASGETSLAVSEQIGVTFSSFYFWQNLVTFLLALLAVSHALRIFGIPKAIRLVPAMMVVGYAVIAVAPAVGFLPVFSTIWMVKIVEKSSNYSLNNTIRGALFLPTSQTAKYEGKTTIDAFFWRFGDLLQAGIIFVALRWLGLGVTEIALFTMGLAAVMVWLAVLLGRRYSLLASTNVSNAPPELVRSIPDMEVPAGASFALEVAADTFTDPDPGEVLTLSAALADGGPLPGWMEFDTKRRLFIGTVPPDVTEDIPLRVTATDVDGASVSDTLVFKTAPNLAVT
jgi:AAA family ATP:ADP antiporter